MYYVNHHSIIGIFLLHLQKLEMSEVKTFIPKTPVEFSAGLISALDSSNDSTFSRIQKKDQLVQLEINNKLTKLQAEKSSHLAEELKSKILTSDDSKLGSSKELNDKLTKLTEDLNKINSLKPAKSPALAEAELKLTQCLITNKTKPLNCWDEMSTFKTLARDF